VTGLTYANQVGAPGGLNQAAPGTFIPEDFVRWSQDVLFDRAGLLRRRKPFETFALYDNAGSSVSQPSVADERVLGVISTLNFDGDAVFGIVVTNDRISAAYTKIYFYDKDFKYQSFSTLDAFSSNAILSAKSDINNSLWIGILDEYGLASDTNKQQLYYWRGGTGVDGTTISYVNNSGPTPTYGICATISSYTITETVGAVTPSNEILTNVITITLSNPTYTNSYDYTELSKGMFCFARKRDTGEEYYVGDVKSFNYANITLEKNVLVWPYYLSITSLNSEYDLVFYNTRPYIHNHGRGLLTIEKGATNLTGVSGPIGSEGEGHFAAAGLGEVGQTFTVFRASDNLAVGRLVSTASYNAAPDNETLKFAYNTASSGGSSVQYRAGSDFTVKMAADEYVIYDTTKPVSWHKDRTNKKFPGVFHATYSGLNWYGNAGELENQNRIVFSAPHNSESVDLSKDSADSILLPTNQQMRGMATSNSGLLVFFEDKTYIIRGNYRLNFSVEELYPEGCLSAQSIVEFGGGVFWASKRGIMLFDGNTVRNLVQDNLGAYYTDSIKPFDAINNAVYAFVYKDYLFMHFTRFQSPFNPVRYEPIYAEGIDTTEAIANYTAEDWDPDFEIDDFDPVNNVPIYWDYIKMYKSGRTGAFWGEDVPSNETYWGNGDSDVYWGPIYQDYGMTFAIYLPTNAITTLSNFDFRGFTSLDLFDAVRGLVGVNAVNPTGVVGVAPRIIDLDSMMRIENNHTTSEDSELCENVFKPTELYYKGPDFYLQTKHYTFGDPTLRKWFRQLFLNLYQIDGGLRLDIVDNEDKDLIDIEKKRHRNWEIFVEDLYNWGEIQDVILPKQLSPNRSTWENVENVGLTWYEFSDAQYERRKKKFSWRYPSMGFRLYQMNNFRPRNYQTVQRPHTVDIDSWSIGFKPMRQSRV